MPGAALIWMSKNVSLPYFTHFNSRCLTTWSWRPQISYQTSNHLCCLNCYVAGKVVGFRPLWPPGAWGPLPLECCLPASLRCWRGNMEASAELRWWGRPQGTGRRRLSEGPRLSGSWWNRRKEKMWFRWFLGKDTSLDVREAQVYLEELLCVFDMCKNLSGSNKNEESGEEKQPRETVVRSCKTLWHFLLYSKSSSTNIVKC